MLDVKEAAQKASEYFAGLYGHRGNVQLEEVELTDDGQYWLITLSYPVPFDAALSESQFSTINFSKRKYKVFKIDANTGGVKSMKIREVE